MSKVPCHTIGRDAAAAIPVQHQTVSRLHAEAIPLPDGRLYLTDCASRNGTFVNEDGRWRRISQDFAGAGARVRFGEVEMSVPALLSQISHLRASGGAGKNAARRTGASAARQEERQEERLDASRGVALDPETGEPVAVTDKPGKSSKSR